MAKIELMRILRLLFLLLLYALVVPMSPAQDRSGNMTIDYVLDRYVEEMGGRASLQKIKSVRLIGEIVYPDGNTHAITILKKKPNLVRVILDTGTLRIIQGYDGENAWFAREQGRNLFVDRMRGAIAKSFIRNAPLENALINAYGSGAEIELGEDIDVAKVPCYQVICSFPDGSKDIHCIDKDQYKERRVYRFDENGKLTDEIIPSKFELFGGVTFALQTLRVDEGKAVSTVIIKEVQINLGILDTAFAPPAELPPQ